ncbi:MAG: hypothetical protein ING19_16135 [Azospirillum sp.]|nr:hypothetical protein [Azospirillum sp.]
MEAATTIGQNTLFSGAKLEELVAPIPKSGDKRLMRFRDAERFGHRLKLVGKIVARQPIAIKLPDQSGLPRMGGMPYVPASTLRGVLRSAAANWLLGIAVDGPNAEKISLASFYLAKIGGVKSGKAGKNGEADEGADGEADKTAKNVNFTNEFLVSGLLRTVNPMAGIFGAGDPFAAGALYVSHATLSKEGNDEAVMKTIKDQIAGIASKSEFSKEIPQAMRIPGVRRDPVVFKADGVRFLDHAEFDTWVRQRAEAMEASNKKKAAEKNRKNEQKKKEEGNGNDEQLAAANREANAKLESVFVDHPGLEFEALPAGTVLDHGMRLEKVSLSEIGLFLESLAAFAENPRIGGQLARGCGLVDVSYDVFVASGRGFDLRWEKIDEISISEENGISMPQSDLLRSALEANREAATTLPRERGGYYLGEIDNDFVDPKRETPVKNADGKAKKRAKTGDDPEDPAVLAAGEARADAPIPVAV